LCHVFTGFDKTPQKKETRRSKVTLSAEILTLVSLCFYAAASVLYLAMWAKSSLVLRVIAPLMLGLGLFANLYQLFGRWLDTSQPPFKTLYESLVLLAACIAIVYFFVELVYRARILGLPGALGCVLAMAYAYSSQYKEAVNLPPALQSGWFIPHVVIYFFGYAALALACGAALLYLIRPKPVRLGRKDLVPDEAINLEALIDGAVRFGFALLTAGLLIGALWAKEAWGDYWVWDPKETWSLVSWLVFAAYLHLYYMGNWRGKRLAILVLVGFGAVIFTYLFMHLLPTADQSIHVYQ
jgi:cytochrome c-type biogenesis protein CcsB